MNQIPVWIFQVKKKNKYHQKQREKNALVFSETSDPEVAEKSKQSTNQNYKTINDYPQIEDAEYETDSEPNEQEKKKKKSSKKKLACCKTEKYPIIIGEYETCSAYFKESLNILSADLIRLTIYEVMTWTVESACSLKFYGGRYIKGEYVIYACYRFNEAGHKFRFDIYDFDKPTAKLLIRSTINEQHYHDEAEVIFKNYRYFLF